MRIPKRLIRRFSLFLLLSFCSVTAADPQPTLPSAADLQERRQAIYAELDQNVETVKQCFEILDDTPTTDLKARQFLDAQIQQFDDRSSALHEELEEIERHEFLAQHRSDLVKKLARLQSEAKQLRQSGHLLPAKLRQAQAVAIQRTLDDGTWKILADPNRCESKEPGTDLASILQLNLELKSLKLETKQLRQELQELRATVKRLEARQNPKLLRKKQ